MIQRWKQWKRGLIVAGLHGLFTGIMGLAVGVTWKQAGLLVLISVSKDAALFIQKHPVEKLQDTISITRAEAQEQDKT